MKKTEKEPINEYVFTLPDAVRKLVEQKSVDSQQESQKKLGKPKTPCLTNNPKLIAVAKRYEDALFKALSNHRSSEDGGRDFIVNILKETYSSVAWTSTTSKADDNFITSSEISPMGYLIVLPPGHASLQDIGPMANPSKLYRSSIVFRPEPVTEKYAAALLAYALSVIYQSNQPIPDFPKGVDLMLLRTGNSYGAKGTVLDLITTGKFGAFITEYIKHYGTEHIKEMLRHNTHTRRNLFTHLDLEIFGGPAKNDREKSGRDTIYIHRFLQVLVDQEEQDATAGRSNIIQYMRQYHDWAKHL